MWPATYHFFVYKVKHGETYDQRCPCGGVVVTAWSEKSMVWKAFTESHRRYPCRPGELLVVDRVTDKTQCRQAMLLDKDWERAFAKFEELMTVS